jgi:hypothetical protein
MMEFRFELHDLGRYPAYVGFVVTEANNPFADVEFGTATLTGPEGPDRSYDPLDWTPRLDGFPGDTRTHRFFGVYAESGITRLYIRNVAQMDHLQYGYAIPEPGVGSLALLGGLLGLVRRRSSPRC